MRGRLMKSESVFEFHIDGSNEIPAEALAKTITDMAHVTEAVAMSQNPDAYIKLHVTAFRDGCFQVNFKAIAECGAALLPIVTQTVCFADTVINLVKQSFELRKILGGKAPKEIKPLPNNQNEVLAESGAVFIFNGDAALNLSNVVINNGISDISRVIRATNTNCGFKLKSSAGDAIFESEDVASLSSSAFTVQESTYKRIRQQLQLTIRRLDLEGDTAWTFTHMDKQINAKILDAKWLNRLHNRKIVFTTGDSIQAIVETEYELNSDGTTQPKPTSCNVLEVIGEVIHADNNDTEQLSIE